MFFLLMRILFILIIITAFFLIFRRLTRKETLTGSMEDARKDKEIFQDYKRKHKPVRRRRRK